MTPLSYLFDFWNVLLIPGYQGEQLNTDLLSYIKVALPKERTYILTSSPPILLSSLSTLLEPAFNRIFTTAELGMSKSDSAIYTVVAQQLASQPKNILFIDDSEKNIMAAAKAGMQTHLFQNNTTLLQHLKEYSR